MRELQFRPKIPVEVTIPKPLKEFICLTYSLIQSEDFDAVQSSDDLIQTHAVFGGLIEDGGDRYSMTYFPGRETNPTWDIELTAGEIAHIALQKTKTLLLWKCAHSDCDELFPAPDVACAFCDYVDNEPETKADSPPHDPIVRHTAPWARRLIRHFPEDEAKRIIERYQPAEPVQGDLFTDEETEHIIAESKSYGGHLAVLRKQELEIDWEEMRREIAELD